MNNDKVIDNLDSLKNDAKYMKNYDAYIKIGDVDSLKNDMILFFESVLAQNATSHKDIKNNFNTAIKAKPRGELDFEEFIATATCVLGDDLNSIILDGEYVLLQSKTLEIALIKEFKNEKIKKRYTKEELEKMVYDEFIDKSLKIEILNILQNVEFGTDTATMDAEKALNESLGPRWTVFASFEEQMPLFTFAKSGEFLHFSSGNDNILVAYHALPLVEVFESLTIEDITNVELYGDIAKRYIDRNFKENLIEKLRGVSTSEQAVTNVQTLLTKRLYRFVAFARSVSKPKTNEFTFFTIKQYNLLIVFQ